MLVVVVLLADRKCLVKSVGDRRFDALKRRTRCRVKKDLKDGKGRRSVLTKLPKLEFESF